MTPLRLLDLFSGIGGFSLGLERSGAFRTVAFCEIEQFCREQLAWRWPKVPRYEDVRSLSGDLLEADGITVEAICGGFPCQDISCAGKGAGLEGERSGLWFEYARLIGEIRPLLVVIENVPRIRTLGVDRILNDLETLGYSCEPLVVGARHVGAPHRRQRAWLVAYPIGSELREQLRRRCGSSRQESPLSANDGAQGAVADTDGESLERLAIARLQPHPWHAEPPVGRVVDGLPARLVENELRAFGNAVVPQIPEMIGRAIIASMGFI